MTHAKIGAERRRRSKTVAMGLWIVFALVVFSVTFDWKTRLAGHAFVQSQITRHTQGQPTLSIDEAFRPMVRDAAREAAVWLLLIVVAGAAGVAVAREERA